MEMLDFRGRVGALDVRGAPLASFGSKPKFQGRVSSIPRNISHVTLVDAVPKLVNSVL